MSFTKVLYSLLALIPVALLLHFVFHAPGTVIFVVSGLALVPLAALLGQATEQLAIYTGPRIGALIQSTLGNAAELIITIVALRAGLLAVVKASITGSILGNILLVLGLSLFLGGVKHGQQRFDRGLAGTSSTMMTLAIAGLVIPAIFSIGGERLDVTRIEELSVGVAVLLILVYCCYLAAVVFGVGRRRDGQDDLPGDEVEDETPEWSRSVAIGVLVAATLAIVAMSEILVGSIEEVGRTWGLTEAFLGVMIVPLIGNVAENLVAVQAALANKMDLSLSISLGSSLQVALFVAPVLVFVSLLVGHPLSLLFNVYELGALAVAVGIATFIAMDGESNWLEGIQLLAVYVILGIAFFLLPGTS
jgi:Ca2+:H+ antiporter